MRALKEITAPELLAGPRRIEARGAHETAHRVKARAGPVFRYATATGRAERDPAADLRGALAPIVVTHRAALTDPAAIGGLLRAIDSYKGYPVTIAALKLAPMFSSYVLLSGQRSTLKPLDDACRLQRFDERRQMMQARADYLDSLRQAPAIGRDAQLPTKRRPAAR